MKKLILLTAASILLGILCSAAPVIRALSFPSLIWNSSASWNLQRGPQAGDTVIIPVGTTVVVTNHENFGNGNLFIKIYGTLKFTGGILTMGTGSTIIVHAGGRITGTNSNSEQIRLGSTKVYQGNPDVVGPQYANATTGSGFSPYSSTLPVQFVSFTLSQSNGVLVQWTTTTEVNAASYEVERSENGTSWTTLASVAATGNSSNALNYYSYTDRNNYFSKVYYRIRQIDLDGSFAYTPVKSISGDELKNIKIYSSSQRILLQFPQAVKGTVSVRIISANGQLMKQQTISNAVGQVIMDTHLKGNYFVTVSNGQDIQTAGQVIL